jgi:M6 family metalloprotease-like protein
VLSTRGVRLFVTSRLLVIPARFADGASAPVTSVELELQLFGGKDGGPAARAFSHASGGGFTLTGQVTKWVTTSVTIASYGQGTGLGQYLSDALQLVDSDIDFGRYDNDGPDGFPNSGDDDGIVDGGVAVVNSELNRYCNGGTGRGPHPFAITNYRPNNVPLRTADQGKNGGFIQVVGFTLMSATGCSASTAGGHVLAHELGHLFFGLPDLYHPVGGQGEVWATRRWVSGCWELMAAGAWGCGTGPPDLDYRFNTFGAWPRSFLGWVGVVTADPTRDMTYELNPLGRGGTVLRVPVASDEYLLLEYREAATAADARLPTNGVLITHVAEALTQFPPTLQSPYRVSLIEADDDSTLLRTELEGGNRGAASDAFGVGVTSLRPGIHSRARAVDGTPFRFEITGITIDGAAHRAQVRIAPAVVAQIPR